VGLGTTRSVGKTDKMGSGFAFGRRPGTAAHEFLMPSSGLAT
jgi:hypothetical protein